MWDDDDDKINTPWGEENPNDLTTGGAGSGASSTDTGGLDVNGNELGSARPGPAQGKTESERMDEAEQGARKP